VRFNLSEAVEYNSNAPAVAADAVVWQAAKPSGAFEPKPTMTLQTWSS
jgi:hypothetical protein